MKATSPPSFWVCIWLGNRIAAVRASHRKMASETGERWRRKPRAIVVDVRRPAGRRPQVLEYFATP